MVMKVKEPQAPEVAMLRAGQTLFTYLHLAPDPELTRGLMASGATCVAYETVEDAQGRLPLLAPMSEVAGKIATQAGAFFLEKPLGGRGILLGGVPGVAAANVMVIGGGAVGFNAASIAIGMEADVFVFDLSIDRLRELDVAFAGRASTVFSSTLAIEEMLPRVDLVIGAVLVHGAKAPHVISREQLKLMKRNAVLVDVAIDQGGCFETSKPTTHADPTFEVDGITHYCVANMPGAVPITSTYALTNATLPYAIALADHGVDGATARDPGLAPGRQRCRRHGHPRRGGRGGGRTPRPGREGARGSERAARRRRRQGCRGCYDSEGLEERTDKERPDGNRYQGQEVQGEGLGAQEHDRRQVRRPRRRRDGGRHQPGERRGDREGTAVDQGGRGQARSRPPARQPPTGRTRPRASARRCC